MSEVSSSELKSEFFTDKKFNLTNSKEYKFFPFTLKWVFGFNSSVPVINLTTKRRTLIAFTCSNVSVLYDYCSRKMLTLQGHTNEIRTLSTNSNGKWLLTADFGKDSVVVVWDTEKGIPICSLFNPHGDAGMTAAKISFDAKYIVTVGNENCQILRFWLWTCGKDFADASIELTETKRDRVKEISFNDNNSDQFILTLEYHVLFITWENKALHVHQPHIIRKKQNFGVFNNSLYLSGSNKAITSTSNGFILVWTYKEETNIKKDTRNAMNFCKAVQLQKSNITQISRHRNIIVLGTSQGHVNFYDEDLKIVYWCHECNFDSISSISFDLSSEFLAPKLKNQFPKEQSSVNEESENYEEVSDDTSNFSRNSESIEETVVSELVETKSNFTIKIEKFYEIRNDAENMNKFQIKNIEPGINSSGPTDATLEQKPFRIEKFIISTKMGRLAWLDVPKLNCRFISYPSENTVTALDLHSELPYMVIAHSSGLIRLFDYVDHKLMISKRLPDFSSFSEIYNKESNKHQITHVSTLKIHEALKSITFLKYSPKSDMLICGLENGVMWILHPDSLSPLDEIPFKHSTEAISNVAFAENSEYFAYSDNAMTVAVFKKANPDFPLGFWNFLGKYHSHYLPIKELLFESVKGAFGAPRFFSLGEDQFLIEYDLAHSGPYPDPGLKILNTVQIELNSIPLSIAWYPLIEDEKFFIYSNSEYKFRLLNATSKKIRATFLGPTFGAPVKMIKILSIKEKNQFYIIFATEKEIGIQMIPLDGNPYKQVGMIGHHQKIIKICLSPCNKFLFTLGYNDNCVLMWKINLRSVEVMSRLGGEGVKPYFRLIEGGKNGWFFKEIQDLFVYSQILQQGEDLPDRKIITDKMFIKQIPTLMRSLGYYPSNEELEHMMSEVSYQTRTETGELVEEINFQEFVKLYINHRPVFGISLQQFKEAFQTFGDPKTISTPTLSRSAFLDVLCGKSSPNGTPKDCQFYGEPLFLEEAYTYLKILVRGERGDKNIPANKLSRADFDFLSESISYKDFATDIMGIELPKERRADENFA